MKIGIDLRIIHYAKTGFNRYAQGVINAIQKQGIDNEYFFLKHPEDLTIRSKHSNHHDLILKTPIFHPKEEFFLGKELISLDLIHFPFSLLPCFIKGRNALTIHDLTCIKYANYIDKKYLSYYQKAIDNAIKCDTIIANSNQTRTELLERNISNKNIVLCYPWTPFEHENHNPFFQKKGDNVPFILSVGSIEPRKNYETLIDSYIKVRTQYKETIKLIIVGWHGWLSDSIFEKIKSCQYRDDISLLKDIEDKRLAELYQNCTLFLNTSFYGGFGYPVIEALYYRACVISSPVPSLIESGFSPECFLDPYNIDSITEKLLYFLKNENKREFFAKTSRNIVSSFYQKLDPQRFIKVYQL